MFKTIKGQVIRKAEIVKDGFKYGEVLVIKSGNHEYTTQTNEFKVGDSVQFTWKYLPCSHQRAVERFYK